MGRTILIWTSTQDGDTLSRVKRLAIFLGLAAVALCCLAVSSAAKQRLAGDLDPSFGQGGVVTQSFGKNEYSGAEGVAVQPDGNIVLAGWVGARGFTVLRYTSRGSLDLSFGKDGIVQTPFEYWGFAGAVALQPDGKIVVAGVSCGCTDTVLSQFTLARYTPNGSPDPTFGQDGITTTPIAFGPSYTAESSASSLAILPDGKILAAGTTEGTDGYFNPSAFAIARYKADGSLDPTFGEDGVVRTRFRGVDRLRGIAVDPDGKIDAVGTVNTVGPHEYHPGLGIARYNPDGSVDHTFGEGGKVILKTKASLAGMASR
jgi:uncharacterized delta-60 repeat protein